MEAIMFICLLVTFAIFALVAMLFGICAVAGWKDAGYFVAGLMRLAAFFLLMFLFLFIGA